MAIKAPNIDPRSAADIAGQVKDLLAVYAPQWKEFDPVTGEPKGMSAALINIFARYCEIIIQRLNQAPDKNFLAFLDLLGASLQPPQPARVPLTFTLAAGSTEPAVVPAGTQAAAPPAEGEKDPVIFETEDNLVVTPAQLASIYTRDPEQDLYADLRSIISSPAAPGAAVFRGNRRNEHVLYLGHSTLLAFPHQKDLSLKFTLDHPLGDAGTVQWEFQTGTGWGTIDGATGQLSSVGINVVDLGALAPVRTGTVNAVENRWLRCRLMTPVARSTVRRQGMVRMAELPVVERVEINVQLQRQVTEGLLPEMGFTNSAPIEPGKDFYPFGEKPRLNDSLYIASSEAFSKDRMFSDDGTASLAGAGAKVTLDVQIANAHILPGASNVRPSRDAQLAWELWAGAAWQRVGTSECPAWISLMEIDPLPEFTTSAQITVQGTAQQGVAITIYGLRGTTSAVVGEDGRFAAAVATASQRENVIKVAASYQGRTAIAWATVFGGAPEGKTVQIVISTAPAAPTTEERLDMKGAVQGSAAATVKKIRVTNGSLSDERREATPAADGSFKVTSIALAEGRNELLIEGLDDSGTAAAATTLMVGRTAAAPQPDAQGFADGTFCFCQSGAVTLRLPDAVRKIAVNGQENYWLRVRLVKGDYGKDAAYTPQDPTDPSKGFMLILASFRPPVISLVRIGYEQTLQGAPEQCLAYNNLEYMNVTEANKAGNDAFAPFQPASEDRPTIYYGLTLPGESMPFPNRPVSLLNRLAERKYGEPSVPVSPEAAVKQGAPGSSVVFTYRVMSDVRERRRISLACAGSVWPASVAPEQILLEPGESTDVTVTVAVPALPAMRADTGWLRIHPEGEAETTYSATFATSLDARSASPERPNAAWEYWNGAAWAKLSVDDDSENFTRPGIVKIMPPSDFARRSAFGANAFWVRAVWKSGEYSVVPRLNRVLLNTIIASQTTTITNEILGSSDQSNDQKFTTTRRPVLDGQQCEVREPEMPTADDQKLITRDEGEDAISKVLDAAGRPKEFWVRWHEVPDFYGSGPRDRHYVIDHLSGEIAFGNGSNGMIPPRGSGNLRMKQYRSGGGARGNRAANEVVQLKTTVPYVEKVINTEAAAGGAEAESLDLLYERAPRTIRHSNRAVTVEDCEDLAMLATPEVARARCVPLRDLRADPLGTTMIPGEISVIIVPRTKESKPLPGLELITRVQDSLKLHGTPMADVHVVGPLYVRVDVTVEIALASLEGAGAVEQEIRSRLAEFLHPLTGGLEGKGWDFGREPYRSDLYALIESISGVDHIRSLTLDDTIEDPTGAVKKTGRFLVYSGAHQISLVFE